MINCPKCGEEINLGKLLNEKRNKKLTKEQRVAIATKASHARKRYQDKVIHTPPIVII